MWKKRRGACSVVFRESDEQKKKFQYFTATHSAVGFARAMKKKIPIECEGECGADRSRVEGEK